MFEKLGVLKFSMLKIPQFIPNHILLLILSATRYFSQDIGAIIGNACLPPKNLKHSLVWVFCKAFHDSLLIVPI